MILAGKSDSSDKRSGEGTLSVPIRFYKKRSLFYTLLLLFVVVIGLPIVSVPHLRNRLSARIMLLKAAVAGNVNPVVAQVGANQNPFPSEYERPEPPVREAFKLPPAVRVIQQTPRTYVSSDPSESGTPPEYIVEAPPQPAEGGESVLPGEAAPGEPEETGPLYQQGEVEQSAYDLLLESNAKIAEMVRGSDPAIVFDSWDAAHRGGDVYWVRVKFQSAGNPVREYIWQINLSSGEVTPLSYHARSIS